MAVVGSDWPQRIKDRNNEDDGVEWVADEPPIRSTSRRCMF